MTAPDWTEFTAQRPFPAPRARRGAMEPATRLRQSPIPAILAVVGGGTPACNVQVRCIATQFRTDKGALSGGH